MSYKLFLLVVIRKIIFFYTKRGNSVLGGAVKWKTVAKVDVAPFLPSCLRMCNISPLHCPNQLRFLVYNSETTNQPVSHAKPHAALRKIVAQLLG